MKHVVTHLAEAPLPDPSQASTDQARLDLRGLKTAVIGGTGGIGRAVAGVLASRGADVIVVGRTLRDHGVARLEFRGADLSLLREARRVGRELPAESLDLVVMTTGIMAAPKRQQTTEGIERDMAVSYLSRLVIVREVAPRLKKREGKAMRPRVFIMGFPGKGNAGSAADLNAEKSYSAMAVHMNTVAGNEMLVLDSTKRYPEVDFFGLNPGMLPTSIRGNMLGEGTAKHRFAEWLIRMFAGSADEYAAHIVPLLVSPDLEGRGGTMFTNKGAPMKPSPKLTADYVAQFITASEALVARAIA
jgi:NAD(P)-dependent dehydrogenase (short-subunit alcohol dehydrogenase family)